jgi:serine protease Do
MNVSLMQPGTTLSVKVLREGAPHEFSVRLAELPTEQARVQKSGNDQDDALDGVSVENLSARAARELGLPASTPGVVVTDIDPGSVAAQSGLRQGDVIQEVNHQAVKNRSDFEKAIHHSPDETLLLVNRQGNTLYLAV